MVDTCCPFASQRIGDAEQREGCVWNVPHSQLTPVCDRPPGGDESLQFYWLQWWRMLPRLEGSGCKRQLPAGRRGRMTGCVCSVRCQGSWAPCSGSTRNYLSLSIQLLVGKAVLLPSWNLQSSTSALYGALKCAFTHIQLFQTLHLESRFHLLLLRKVWMTLPCWATLGQP